MNIQLSDHFSYKKLLRFTVPSIAMMIFTSLYGVVDGIFVSNLVGTTAFAAVNLIMPICMLPGSIGFMLGTGGNALVARLLGEGNQEKARHVFSMLIYVSVGLGTMICSLMILFLEPIAAALGATGQLLNDCVMYGRVLLLGEVAFILQNEFQSYLITAEKPQFGLAVTLSAGVTNIVLDALFVGAFGWGLVGAATATIISQLVGAVIPLIYFITARSAPLHLVRYRFDGRSLFKSVTNGSSEMMTNLSMSAVNMLYNMQLLRLAGENGVAAYGTIMYVNFIFISAFIGYSIGSAPVISYHYGAQNHAELHSLYTKSLKLIGIGALSMYILSVLLSGVLAAIFTGYDPALYALTHEAFLIYSVSYLFAGFNIFGSAFFTALNNGIISAVISFMRTLVFQVLCIMSLPYLFGLNGVWSSIIVAEIGALCITVVLLIKNRKRYHY